MDVSSMTASVLPSSKRMLSMPIPVNPTKQQHPVPITATTDEDLEATQRIGGDDEETPIADNENTSSPISFKTITGDDSMFKVWNIAFQRHMIDENPQLRIVDTGLISDGDGHQWFCLITNVEFVEQDGSLRKLVFRTTDVTNAENYSNKKKSYGTFFSGSSSDNRGGGGVGGPTFSKIVSRPKPLIAGSTAATGLLTPRPPIASSSTVAPATPHHTTTRRLYSHATAAQFF